MKPTTITEMMAYREPSTEHNDQQESSDDFSRQQVRNHVEQVGRGEFELNVAINFLLEMDCYPSYIRELVEKALRGRKE